MLRVDASPSLLSESERRPTTHVLNMFVTTVLNDVTCSHHVRTVLSQQARIVTLGHVAESLRYEPVETMVREHVTNMLRT